jgi:hypothetical protein
MLPQRTTAAACKSDRDYGASMLRIKAGTSREVCEEWKHMYRVMSTPETEP